MTEAIVPLDELYGEYANLRTELMALADMYPDGDDLKNNILENDRRIRDAIAGRDAKVKECHPDGKHWPPHPECPCCRKLAQSWDAQAQKRCAELGLPETEENLEIALGDYLKRRYAGSHPVS